MKKNITLLMGNPALGKSTYITDNFSGPENNYIINRDDIVDKVSSSLGLTYDDMFRSPTAEELIAYKNTPHPIYGNILTIEKPWDPKFKTFELVDQANADITKELRRTISIAKTQDLPIIVDMTLLNATGRGSRESTILEIAGFDEVSKESIAYVDENFNIDIVELSNNKVSTFIASTQKERSEAEDVIDNKEIHPNSVFQKRAESVIRTQDEELNKLLSPNIMISKIREIEIKEMGGSKEIPDHVFSMYARAHEIPTVQESKLYSPKSIIHHNVSQDILNDRISEKRKTTPFGSVKDFIDNSSYKENLTNASDSPASTVNTSTIHDFHEKLRDIAELEISLKKLEESPSDILLSRMETAQTLLSTAYLRKEEMIDALGGKNGILIARENFLDSMNNEEKLEMILDYDEAVTSYQELGTVVSSASNMTSNLTEAHEIKSEAEEKIKLLSVEIQRVEDIFGNSSNIAETKREIEKATIASHEEMNIQENTSHQHPLTSPR